MNLTQLNSNWTFDKPGGIELYDCQGAADAAVVDSLFTAAVMLILLALLNLFFYGRLYAKIQNDGVKFIIGMAIRVGVAVAAAVILEAVLYLKYGWVLF